MPEPPDQISNVVRQAVFLFIHPERIKRGRLLKFVTGKERDITIRYIHRRVLSGDLGQSNSEGPKVNQIHLGKAGNSWIHASSLSREARLDEDSLRSDETLTTRIAGYALIRTDVFCLDSDRLNSELISGMAPGRGSVCYNKGSSN